MPRKPRMTLEERRERRKERNAQKNAKLPPEQREPDRMPQRGEGEVHVPRIMTPNPIVFPPKLKLAIEHYVNISPRDYKKAAELAGMDPAEFQEHLRRSPGVVLYVDDLEKKIDTAFAESVGKARALHAAFLDENLVVAVKAGAADGDTDALELGYDRIGLRRDKNFMTGQQSSTQTRPQIYRVLEHTITRTEEVTQREITAEPAPRQLERATDTEILDY